MKFQTLFLFAIFALIAGSFAMPDNDVEAQCKAAGKMRKRRETDEEKCKAACNCKDKDSRVKRQEWCVP